MSITLWQFVTGDWEGHSFGPIQIACLIVLGLALIGLALAPWAVWRASHAALRNERPTFVPPRNAPDAIATVSGAVFAPDLFAPAR